MSVEAFAVHLFMSEEAYPLDKQGKSPDACSTTGRGRSPDCINSEKHDQTTSIW